MRGGLGNQGECKSIDIERCAMIRKSTLRLVAALLILPVMALAGPFDGDRVVVGGSSQRTDSAPTASAAGPSEIGRGSNTPTSASKLVLAAAGGACLGVAAAAGVGLLLPVLGIGFVGVSATVLVNSALAGALAGVATTDLANRNRDKTSRP
jgi:hypothetical protein